MFWTEEMYYVYADKEVEVYRYKEDAMESFREYLMYAWNDCQKFSVPKNEFYDDNWHTFKYCLREKEALIAGRTYKYGTCTYYHNGIKED